MKQFFEYSNIVLLINVDNNFGQTDFYKKKNVTNLWWLINCMGGWDDLALAGMHMLFSVVSYNKPNRL